jgi:hypothetical protein
MHLCQATIRAFVVTLWFSGVIAASCQDFGCQNLANVLQVALNREHVSCLQPDSSVPVVTTCVATRSLHVQASTAQSCHEKLERINIQYEIQADG